MLEIIIIIVNSNKHENRIENCLYFKIDQYCWKVIKNLRNVEYVGMDSPSSLETSYIKFVLINRAVIELLMYT